MKLVSIVLPTFNGQRFIRKSIESCLCQTYQNIELIIVNDHSTDLTISIIREYANKDNRISVIDNDRNLKLPASLNAGFMRAKGDFFTWTSDDNYYAPHAIETMANTFYESSLTDIVYSSYYFIDEKGNKLDTFGYSPENLLFKCAPGACFLYKRKVHEQLNGFNETKFRMEDMDFWLRAATLFRYQYIDKTDLYYYRKHSDSLSTAIHSSPELYAEYRENHLQSFKSFFNNGLDYYPSTDTLNLHTELYFEDIVRNKNWDFTISERIVGYLGYLDGLYSLAWDKIGFERKAVNEIINEKKSRMINIVINDLVFENKVLQEKNPKIAAQLNKAISWYYKEYEVLPGWYKKIGHIIKAIQGNRTWKSLIKKEARQ